MEVTTDIPQNNNISVTENSTFVSLIADTTTEVLHNLTRQLQDDFGNSSIKNESSTFPPGGFLEESLNEDDIHKNPELKYFSTVIIIFLGLTILIVPVFCFIGVVCARARVFRTVREAAGRGWGFNDADVPYSEFGSDDYTKDKPAVLEVNSSRGKNCDVKILVADDNRVPSSRSAVRGGSSSFLPFNNSSTTDDEDDIPPTFVHRNA